ncbi:MAG TPA: tRNA pseudouridine(38-40) synthase TruA [Phototrophicaceae bacterium]|nr:tRNA pseudouridine(38-40) synthase TruA [Phototrophicaceae bacterium]
MRYKATLAYDGTRYNGFQRQAAGIPTVQGTVEEAIAAVTGQTVTITGAGRTDAGVHATGQVIAFDLSNVAWKHSADALLRAINAVLPDDVALQNLSALGEVAEGVRGFHPRFDATARVYKYSIYAAAQRDPLLRTRAWHVQAALDLDVMRQAAGLLIGEHDFGAFGQPPREDSANTMREVLRSTWTQEDRLLVYEIEANAFLQHMVRRIVGMLVTVGRGAISLSEFEAIFRDAVIVPKAPLAPPQGLVLEQVRYLGDRQP